MKKIYANFLNKRNLFLKFGALAFLFLFAVKANAQNVNVTATAGSLSGSYATLGEAFTAINSSVHQGAITINLNAAIIDEGTVPATLNGNNADPANYTSVSITTSLAAVTVKGNPAQGLGLIQLYGASNITIDGGVAKKITFQNYSNPANGNSSVIRVITNSSSVTSAKNITIKNCLIEGNVIAGNQSSLTSQVIPSNFTYGILFGGGAEGLTNVQAPAQFPNTSNYSTFNNVVVAPGGSQIQNITVTNNTINGVGRAIVFNGASESVGSNLTINNNTIGSVTSGQKGVYVKGIFVSGSQDATITGNTINRIESYINDTLSAIELKANIGGGDIVIQSNTINNVINNNAAGIANGIVISSAQNDFDISSNIITTLKGNNSALGVNGIVVNTNGGGASIYNNKLDDITNGNPSAVGPASGIRLLNAANGAGVFNNFISKVMQSGKGTGGNYNPSLIASGILIESGSFHQILHNSINLYGALPATPNNTGVACLTIASATANKNLKIKNNIFSNTVSSTDAGAFVGIFFIAQPADAAASNIEMNNNAFYTGTNSWNGMALIGAFYQLSNIYKVAGFEPRTSVGNANLRYATTTFGAIAANNDDHSFGTTTAAPFVSPSNLHINNVATGLKSGGVPVGISTDIDNTARNATWPDIGADEFTGTKDDKLPPYITYTKLSEAYCNIGVNRSLSVTITDPSGIGTGTGQPLLYYSTDNANWTAVTGTQAGSVYTFSFGATATLGQTVYYFVAAQDAASPANVGTNPSVGTGNWTTSPPKITIYPLPPNFFVVGSALPAGNYLVGSGGNFSTLASAINAYNTSCLGGNITFTLKDLNYTVNSQLEIFNIEGNATHTLTIRPAFAGTKITGNLPDGSAIFKLNGADYITFDGTDSVTSTPKSLTIENTGAGTTIWIASNGTSNGATNNTIKNCIVKGGSSNNTFAAIIQSSGVEQGGLAESPNNNNNYQNNTINTAQYGIALVGGGTTNDNSNTIQGNFIGSTTPANYIGFRGAFIAQQTNVNFISNEVSGVNCATGTSETASAIPAGVYVAGIITNGKIQKNKIHNIVNPYNSIGGWAIDALSLRSSTANTGLEISNNFIWDYTNVQWSGATPTFSAVGLRITSGGGYKVYYNTITSTTEALTTYSVSGGIQNVPVQILATDGNLDFRNNIFANTRSNFDRISIYVSVSNSVFSNIDYNDYYTTGTNLGYLGSLRANIGAWRTATGKDVHSVNVDPRFIGGAPATFNNHLDPSSQLNHAGVVIGGITTDIDGDVRGAGTGATAPDIGADEFLAPGCSDPTSAIFSSTISKDSICVSEVINLTATGYPWGEGMTYNWQVSTTGAGGPYADIPGAITPSSYSGNVSTTSWFRLRATCGGNSGFTTGNKVVVNNPAILSRTGATRCGFGTVNLSATADPGLTINWYENTTSTVPVATGNSYSPNIGATTTYYVDATAGGSTGTVGLVSPSNGSNIGTQTIDWEMYFNVLQPTTLKSIDIYPMVSGEPYVLYLRNSNGTTLATYNVTTTVSGGATPQTVIINYAFAAPGNGYYLYTDLPSGGVRRNEGGASYPYTSTAINITGNGFDNNYFMGMYNWKFSSGCTSNRLPVVATVNNAPAINITNGSTVSICSGSDTTLVVTGDPSYTSYTWSLSPGGAVVHTGASYTVNPTANTLYYVEAATASGQAGCRNITQTSILVKPVPTDLVLDLFPNSTNFCNGQVPLKSKITGGVLDSIYALQQDFNGATNDWTTTNNTVNSTNPERAEWTLRPDGYIRGAYGPFTSNDNSQFYLSDADWAGSGSTTDVQLTSPTFSLAGFTKAALFFYHSYTKYTNDIFARVEISNNGGATWTLPFLRNYTATQGTRTAFVRDSIDLTPYLGQTNLKIRFNYKSNWGFQWAIDNVKILGKQQLNITWSPNYQMFLGYQPNGSGGYDGINPYVPGTHADSVYVQPFVDTTYTAIVTSPDGCSKSSSLHVITVNAPVSVTNTTPALLPRYCQGEPFTFTSTGTNPGSIANNFQWKNVAPGALDSIVALTNSIQVNTAAKPLRAGNYAVTAYLNSNVLCATNNPARSTDTLFFVIDSILPVSVTITSNLPTICAGSNVTFTALGANAGLNPGYQWQINGSNVPGATNSTFTTNTLVAGDSVRVVITSDEKCTFGTTANSNKIGITVNPVLPVSVNIAANPGVNICVGTNVTFTATPTNGGGTPTYQWYKNSSLLPGETNSTYTSNTLANNDQVYVILTSSETCQSGGPATSNTLTIVETGSVPVSVSLSYPGAPGPICGTGAITYTATGVNPGLAPIYEFSVGGTPMQTSGSNTFSTTVSPGDIVSVQLTSSLSCATGNPATASLGGAVVRPIPAAPSVTPAGALPICAGSSATLTSSIATGITWSTTATTPTINVSTAGNYSVTQTVNGCTSAPSNVVVVTIKPLPAKPTITAGGPTTFCQSGSVNLTASAATGGATYLWSTGATTQTINATTAGNYTVQYVLNGCNGPASNPTTVTVTPAPVVTISGGTNFCGAPVLLTANATTSVGTITNYQWQLGGANIVGATFSTYSATAIGNYTVIVTNSLTCSTTSAVHTIVNDISPMIGIYTISTAPASCTNFQSFKSAVNALNIRKIAGNVTFNVTPGFVEPTLTSTISLGNDSLNASVGAFTITFQKNGVGVNPLIKAYAGGTMVPASNNPDGIWAISGTDNVTIDGIDLLDENTGNPATMEYGFGFFKLSAPTIDGVQNATVKNCVITMSKVNDANGGANMPEGSKGIMFINGTQTAATTALVPTTAAGANSNNKIYSNTINFSQNPISFYGYNAPSPYTLGDNNNDIGGSSSATGNTILNFGSATGILNSMGIKVNYQWGVNISYNIINNNNGGGFDYPGILKGIFAEKADDANANINNNTVTLNKGGTTSTASAIEIALGNRTSSLVNNTVNVNNNSIKDCNFLTGTSGIFSGINFGTATSINNVNVNGNTFSNIKLNGSAIHVILNGPTGSVAIPISNVNTNNNTFTNIIKSGTSHLRILYMPTSAFSNWIADGNLFDGIENNTTGILDVLFTQSLNALNVNFTNNILRNIGTNTTGTINGITEYGSNDGTKYISNNKVYNFYTTAGGAGGATFTGIYSRSGTATVDNNEVYSLNSTGTTGGNGGTITGISVLYTPVANAGVLTTVKNNKIYDLSSNSTKTTNLVIGLSIGNVRELTAFNNYISDLRAPNANTNDAIRGISHTNSTASSNVNLYYNTVFLNATSTQPNFGSSAIYATSSGTSTTATLDMRNNIFYNASMAGSAGIVTAYRRSSGTFANYASTSNYNLYYSGTPGPNHLILYNTSNYQTLANFKSVSPGDQNSISAEPIFVNSTTTPYDLHLDENYNCSIEGQGNNAGILIQTDFDGDVRQTVSPFKTDIGADEFNGPAGGPFTWRGVDNDWENKANWCNGVPDATSAVIIPAGAPNYPILTSLTNKAGTIVIDAGANITITTGTLTVSGATFNVNGTLTNNGMVVFNGTMPQSFPIGTGSIAAMKGIEVNNTSVGAGSGLTFNKDFGIDSILKPTKGNINLNNSIITLRSTTDQTAQVSALGAGVAFNYSGTGKFIGEQFIRSAGRAGWRFIAVQTNTAQTIRESWQEGGITASTGYGMQVVGPNSAGTGFDVNNPLTSLKTYNPVTNGYTTVPGTNGPVKNSIGYLAFIRGDRSMTTVGPTNNTILRTQGPINTGNINVTGTTTTDKFIPVGNPYPSAIDFTGITKNTGIGNFFYVWDPKLGGAYGYGRWQTVVQASPGMFTVTPGGGSYPSDNLPHPIRIESGQAFLLYTTNTFVGPNYSIGFKETDKSSGSNNVTRPEGGIVKSLVTTLYQGEGVDASVMDGARIDFDNSYSALLDINDAVKANNDAAGFGISSNSKTIAVERRPELVVTDTIQFVNSALPRSVYQLEITPSNIATPTLQAYLEDNYLNTKTPISLEESQRISFKIDNNAGSAASDRFRIVFNVMRPLPVTFTRVEAVAIDKDVKVNWVVDNEINIRNYNVERSVDGRNFQSIATVDAGTPYNYLDVTPGTGKFFYRIRSNDFSGEFKYSNIVSAVIGGQPTIITIYPNPIKDNRVVKVNIKSSVKGEYQLRVINQVGQVILTKRLIHAGGSMVYDVELGQFLTKGSYNLQIVDPEKIKTIYKFVY